MAFPSLADIRYRVRTILNELTASLWTDSCLNRIIDDANKDSAIKGACIVNTDTITTVASSRFVPIMGYLVKAVEYLPSTGSKYCLVKITPNMVGHVTLNGSAPQYWYQWGKQIGIEPVPNAAYNLSVSVIDFPAGEMTSDADEPDVPASFQTILAYYTVYKALLRSGKYSSSAMMYKQYLHALSETKNTYVDTIPDGYLNFRVPPQTIQKGV